MSTVHCKIKAHDYYYFGLLWKQTNQTSLISAIYLSDKKDYSSPPICDGSLCVMDKQWKCLIKQYTADHIGL